MGLSREGGVNKTLEQLLTDGTQLTQIVDSEGNKMSSHESADGDYHLGVTVEQNILVDTNNSSSTNLTSENEYTFIGDATSTLGVVGLQWSLKTDQNATVYIEESDDDTSDDGNWDISYSFNYIAVKGGRGETVQATKSYWRIRVVLTGTTDTTYFRLSGVLCPIAFPLPSALNADGRLKTASSLYDVQSDIEGKITPFGRLKTAHAVRIIGTAFSGTTKDTNFWLETGTTLSGSVTQAGEITLATGTTADSVVKYQTARKARHVAGTANEFKFTGRLVTAPQANNIRRCGVYDANDGFFFQVNGTTFGIGSRKGGADTIVNSGSFNGNYGSSLTIGTSFGNFVIWYWEREVKFFVNGLLLHTLRATTASLANTNTFPITMENINSGGNTTNNSFEILVASVVRFGELKTESQYAYIAGVATPVLKYGAGKLHCIIINDNSGSFIVYDGITAGGTIIASVDCSKGFGTLTYGCPFSTGLYIATTGAGVKITVVYE